MKVKRNCVAREVLIPHIPDKGQIEVCCYGFHANVPIHP